MSETQRNNGFLYVGILMISSSIMLVLCCTPHEKSLPYILGRRKVGAWLWAKSENFEQIKYQLVNASSWGGLLDVVQVGGCGWAIDGGVMMINKTLWDSVECRTVLEALIERNIDVHMWVGGVPNEIFAQPEKFTNSVRELLKKYNFVKGIHFDDETECAPRANIHDFKSWLEFMNIFSDRMHELKVQVTVAVQAIFGIENVPYEHNHPCLRAPWKYKTDPELIQLLPQMRVDRFLEMDTYYFTLARYLNALDWYVESMPIEKLGVAVANHDVNPLSNADEYLSRVYALDKTNVDWWNFYALPIDENWLEWAWRWKTRCMGCPNLSCFDLDVQCSRP